MEGERAKGERAKEVTASTVHRVRKQLVSASRRGEESEVGFEASCVSEDSLIEDSILREPSRLPDPRSRGGRNSEALHAACNRKRRSSACYGFDADVTAPVKERPGRSGCRESSRNALAREEQRKSERQLAAAALEAATPESAQPGPGRVCASQVHL